MSKSGSYLRLSLDYIFSVYGSGCRFLEGGSLVREAQWNESDKYPNFCRQDSDFVLPLTVFRSWWLLLFLWTQQVSHFNDSIYLFIMAKATKPKTQPPKGLHLWKITKYLTSFIKCHRGDAQEALPALQGDEGGWLLPALCQCSFAGLPSREVSHPSQVLCSYITFSWVYGWHFSALLRCC